tara:strand:+ start:1490 stop:1693 length:204 start_codon:yes stop_codon:yes gene_type:complete
LDESGFYTSLLDCQSNCITSSISENSKNNKQIKKITNLLGQEIPLRKNTTMFFIYDDGSVEKRVVIE